MLKVSSIKNKRVKRQEDKVVYKKEKYSKILVCLLFKAIFDIVSAKFQVTFL